MSNSIIKKTFYIAAVITLTLIMSVTAFSAYEGETTTHIAQETTQAQEETTTQAAEETPSPEEPTTEVPVKPEKTGFITEDGELYYYLPETGERFVPAAAGVHTFDGKAYLFYADGRTVKYNPESINITFSSVYYCLDEDNSLRSGLIKNPNGYTYYFSPDTYKLVKGWYTLEDGKRYFNSKGRMVTGLVKISGKNYYFNDNGVMKTGFVTFKEGKRYFGSDGVMCTGLTKVSKKTYYFNSKGIMQTGWVDFKEGKRRFHLETGVMLTGKKKISGKYYYFNSNGIRKTGWVTIDGNKYYFSKKTAEMLKGWNKISGEYYYFNSSGKMAKSTIVGNYYVLSDGTRAESAAVSYAVKAVKNATNSKMTQEQKLKACYNWIIKNFYYERDYQDPAKLKNNWTKSYAEYAFQKKRGNCYKYASAMGYCAEILGYDARVAYGKIASGNSRTNHGWTEIKINGTYYIFDTVQADYYKGNYYKRTYKNYPRTLYKSGTKAITLS